MELAGFIAAVLIGISLGMIGGGGSILTVPVLVYLFHIDPATATSYSLFIVGSTSLIGAYSNYRKQQVSIPTVFLFGTASVLTTLAVRKWLVPAIPTTLFTVDSFVLTKAFVLMIIFAVLMMAAAISMIRPCKNCNETLANLQKPAYGRLFFYGILIGLVTGLLGAGGGFLLIPALLFLVKMPMKKAVGTSLLIIALNSLIGFTGDIGHYTINWPLLALLTVLAVSGIVIGSAIGKKIDGNKLKKGFGWFVLIMGIYIITAELIKQAV